MGVKWGGAGGVDGVQGGTRKVGGEVERGRVRLIVHNSEILAPRSFVFPGLWVAAAPKDFSL